jgi:hypothetical protein
MTDAPDDDTIRVRRSWSGEPPGSDGAEAGIDETTAVSQRRSRVSAAEPTTAPLTTADPNAPGPRRSTYIDGPLDTEESTDGSTIVARRESRRRATRLQSAADPDPTASASARISGAPALPPTEDGRRASARESANPTYGVRRSQPVVAEREEVAPSAALQPGQAPPDGAAADSRRRHDDRRATLIVVGTASAIAVAAASALIAIVLSL